MSTRIKGSKFLTHCYKHGSFMEDGNRIKIKDMRKKNKKHKSVKNKEQLINDTNNNKTIKN